MGEMRRFLISEVDEAFCRQCIIQNSVGMQMEGDDDDDDDDLTYSFEVDEDKENPWQPSRSYAAHAPHIVPRTRTAGQSVQIRSSILPPCSTRHSTDRRFITRVCGQERIAFFRMRGFRPFPDISEDSFYP